MTDVPTAPAADVPPLLVTTVTDAYLTCGLWADVMDEDGEEVTTHDLGPEHVSNYEDVRTTVAAFLHHLATERPILYGIVVDEPEQAGHDAWLSSNGHGTGFWDRGYGELGNRLHALAVQRIGPAHIYVSGETAEYVRG